MRDYVSSRIQNTQKQLEELSQLEQTIKAARGRENKATHDAAERRAQGIRVSLLTRLPPAAAYEFLSGIGQEDVAVKFRSQWQQQNLQVNCLHELTKGWKEGRAYYEDVFAKPIIDLSILPAYSFVLQFTFTLAQPYLSRDEQDFAVLDNPVRKEKIFGLPYVASTSWKGSLRAACHQLQKNEGIESETVSRLFGNEKDEQDHFHAGCLYFFPTFFTQKSLEVINPQDRKQRVGSQPILFESVPLGAKGIFTLLSVPANQLAKDTGEIRGQVAHDLSIVVKGVHAMFCKYGFGAKTQSGFGLAKEEIQQVRLEVRARDIPTIQSEQPLFFEQLLKDTEKLARELSGGGAK